VGNVSELGRTEKSILSTRKKRGTLIAALIDPEDFSIESARKVAKRVQQLGVSLILVGGSTIADQRHLDEVVMGVKLDITIPVVLFPGNITGISRHADAILFSSLLNSTNTYFLIGAQAIGSIQVMKTGLEAIPMGYLVFGEHTSTGFVGQVRGIPLDKPQIAVMYAMAAHYMGMRSLYLEMGSGASITMPPEIVAAVREYYPDLLIVGGGITSPEAAAAIAKAGADVIVIGNLLQTKGYEDKLAAIVKAVK
jgi:phosphoglycerol geranylgeranyltransferase